MHGKVSRLQCRGDVAADACVRVKTCEVERNGEKKKKKYHSTLKIGQGNFPWWRGDGFPSATLQLKLRSFALTIQIPANNTCFNVTPAVHEQETFQVPLRLDTVPAEPAPPAYEND